MAKGEGNSGPSIMTRWVKGKFIVGIILKKYKPTDHRQTAQQITEILLDDGSKIRLVGDAGCFGPVATAQYIKGSDTNALRNCGNV